LEGQTPIPTMMIHDGRKTREKLLKVPLKEWLRDPVDEAAVWRMWRVIESRCARHRSRPTRFFTIVPALALAASVGAAAYMRHDCALLQPGDAKAIAAAVDLHATRAWSDSNGGNGRNAVWCAGRTPLTGPAILRSAR
jgi:hypothetical protein